MKKILSGLAVLLVLLVAAAGMAAAEETLTLNTLTNVEINIPGDVAIYSFTPSQTGMYRFYSTWSEDGSWADTYGYLLDSDRELVTKDDDSGEENHFNIIRRLTANRTYYFAASMFGSDTTGTFRIELDKIEGVYALAKESRVYTQQGQTGTAEVEAFSPNGGLTYQWYDGDTAIAGATGSTYTFPALTQAKDYRCVITDSADMTAEVTVGARISTGLRVFCEGGGTVEYGGSATLTVSATAVYGEDQLTYQWWESFRDPENGYWHEEPLDGETGKTLTLTNIIRNSDYYCVVTDVNGDVQNSWSSVSILDESAENMLSAVGETEIETAAGSSWTMAVTAETEYTPVQYFWNKVIYNAWGDEDWQRIVGANEASYTLANITASGTYVCEAVNSIGYSATVYFYVSVTDGFSLSEDSDTAITMSPTETKTMKVKAEHSTGTVNYQWYYYEPAFNRYVPIRGAAGASYELSGNNVKGGSYCCKASDETENESTVYFDVTVENAFTVQADSETELQLAVGATATLKVKATGSNISYRWYERRYNITQDYYTESSLIEDERTDSLTITCDGRCEYQCVVFDLYGNRSSVYFQIRVDNGFSASVQQTSYTVNTGDSVTLSATAECTVGSLTYRWMYYSDYRNTVVKESEENYLVIEPVGADNFGQYELRISDEYGNTTWFTFYVAIENHFTAEAEGDSNITVEPGENVTLTVSASCDAGGLSFQWYERVQSPQNPNSWYYSQMSGKTENTLELTNIQGAASYYCRVRDDFGGNQPVWFYIYVENELTAQAHDGITDFTVEPGEPVIMTVDASCKFGELSYQWYEEKDNSWYGNNPIYGATDAGYTISEAGSAGRYVCIVKDQYGNSLDVWFWVYIENDLTVRAINDITDFTIQPGEDVTMAVNASCTSGELSYQWYEEIDNSWYGDNPIAGETGADYTITEADRAGRYVCVVRDTYGNSRNIWFWVYIENDLLVRALNNETFFYVPEGDTVELTVTASCRKGELSYQWHRQYQISQYSWNDEIIEGATTATCTTDPVSRNITYYCEVRDEYDNRISIGFSVYIDNELNVVPVGTKYKKVAPETDVTLAVTATCKSGGLTYKWYKQEWHDNGDGTGWFGFGSNPIPGATGSSYIVENVASTGSYRCIVTDKYFTTQEVDFYIYVDNNLKFIGFEYIGRIPYGEQATLSVSASCTTGELHYQWYADKNDGSGSQPVEGATDSSFTSGPLYNWENIFGCIVTDDYGNSINNWMTIYVESGLTAEPDGESVFRVADAPITMTVRAENKFPDLEISYAWYDDNYNLLASGSENSYTLTNPTQGRYHCDVRDGGDSNQTVYFYVTAADPIVYTENSSNYYRAGETATLKVIAWNEENDLIYQWYDRDRQDPETGEYLLIEGATASTYTFTVSVPRHLICRVTGTGLDTELWFETYVRNSITFDETGLSRVNLIPAGGSLQLTMNATCELETELTYSWYRNGQYLEDEHQNTLTVTEAGEYRCNAHDPYGSGAGITLYCIDEATSVISEGQKVTNSENSTAFRLLRPAAAGTYLLEAEGWVEVYRPGRMYSEASFSGTTNMHMDAGETLYVRLYSGNSFQYTLMNADGQEEDQPEYSITVPNGLRLDIPSQRYYRGNYLQFDHAASSDLSIIRINDRQMNLRKEGTADVTVTYQDGTSFVYHITVATGNTLTLPGSLQTIEEDAFNGDTSAKFIRLGNNVQTVKKGAFANMGTICLILGNDTYTSFENEAFSNSNPVFICMNGGYAESYMNNLDIPAFYGYSN